MAAGDSYLKYQSHESPKGVALIVHGMNFKFEKLKGLESLFHDCDVFSLRLSGHHSSEKIWQNITRRQWLSEWEAAFLRASERARELQVPIFYCGFSLGGVLAIDWMLNTETNKAFDFMFLFAPALGLPVYSRILRPLFYLPMGINIPSFSQRDYRTWDYTSIAAYRALFHSADAVQNPESYIIDSPTHVFLDPQDKLVSFQKVEQYITQNNLSQWTLHEVSTQEGLFSGIDHHLIIDKISLGPKQWNYVHEVVQNATQGVMK